MSSSSAELARLARDVVDVAWLEGDFVLSSGRRSRHYLDKYLFETQPAILRRGGRHLGDPVPARPPRLAAPPPGAGLPRAPGSPGLRPPPGPLPHEGKQHRTRRARAGGLG